MKTLARNKVAFTYCLYSKKEALRDEWGNETGEYKVVYGTPVDCEANISPATGISRVEQFGDLENYDKVLVTDDISIPIDETSVLFVDRPYTEDEEKNPLYDYIVKRVARSLNSVSIAIRKVDVG